MKLNDTIDFQNVGELTRRLTVRKITPARFSLEVPVRDAANGIYSAMRAEVAYRSHKLVLDSDTRSHIEQAAEWLTDPLGKHGLLLMGTYGNGKTTLMRAIARLIAYVTEEVLGYSKRKEVPVMSAKAIARLCSAGDSARGYFDLFSKPFLAIDDMGQEPKEVMHYGMLHTPMIDIISERYDRQLFTIITTNMTAEQLNVHYGGCIYDRLKELMQIIPFTNPSYRK